MVPHLFWHYLQSTRRSSKNIRYNRHPEYYLNCQQHDLLHAVLLVGHSWKPAREYCGKINWLCGYLNLKRFSNTSTLSSVVDIMDCTRSIAPASPHTCTSSAIIPRSARVHAQPLNGSRNNWISSITATSSAIKEYNVQVIRSYEYKELFSERKIPPIWDEKWEKTNW